MCGLIAAIGGEPDARNEAALRAGLEQMRRRGPDAEGQWSDASAWLGHRRLAIVDLDRRSDQPMHSLCGRYVIVFNGEIYDYRKLRSELLAQGVALRTEGDTEVVLELFARHGPDMLSRLRGMFAFVIWDRREHRAFAARDPYGIKPLYLARTRQGVLLASQVRALMATGLVSREPSPQGQAGFWLLGSVPEPYTWYRDIEPVRPGHSVWITRGGTEPQRCWWDITSSWRNAPPAVARPAEVQEAVREALRKSAADHLVADVPIAVFLSGGIDSGSVAGMMTDAGASDLHGVTVAYEEYAGTGDDEVPAAAAVAEHYGIRHHVRTVTRDEFCADFERILVSMDQPSIDGINTWYASKAVAELGFKVVVSGTGGDELFQGYGSFRQLPPLVQGWQWLARVPGALYLAARLGALQARRSGNNRWRHLPYWLRSIPGAWWLRRSVHAPEDLPGLMGEELAREALREFSDESWIAACNSSVPADPRIALSQIESITYLRNQLLRDADWASMDHSVELRTPLVDAWLLRDLSPYLAAFEHYPGKALLATAPSKPLPDLLRTRPKTGFSIPVKRWANQARPSESLSATGWAQLICQQYARQSRCSVRSGAPADSFPAVLRSV